MKARPILFSGPMVRALIDGQKTQTRRIVAPGNTRLFDPERGSYRPVKELLDIAFEEAADFRSLDGLQVWTAKARDYQMCDRTTWQGSSEYGVVGDLLYVREAWQLHERASDVCTVVFRASVGRSWTEAHEQYPDVLAGKLKAKPFQHGWRPGIHQPRWSSRLMLSVADVRIERLHDISEADAIAEGITVEHVIVGANCNGGRHGEEWADRAFFDGGDEDGYDSAADAYEALWIKINGQASWDANPWVWVVEFAVHQTNVDTFIAARAA